MKNVTCEHIVTNSFRSAHGREVNGQCSEVLGSGSIVFIISELFNGNHRVKAPWHSPTLGCSCPSPSLWRLFLVDARSSPTARIAENYHHKLNIKCSGNFYWTDWSFSKFETQNKYLSKSTSKQTREVVLSGICLKKICFSLRALFIAVLCGRQSLFFFFVCFKRCRFSRQVAF